MSGDHSSIVKYKKNKPDFKVGEFEIAMDKVLYCSKNKMF